MEQPGFVCFSSLPKEIRVQIWKDALPAPRLIEITMTNKQDPTTANQFGWGNAEMWEWTTTAGPTAPSLLQVSKEAREVTLEFYQAIPVCDRSTTNFTKAYVDFIRDTILMSRISWNCLEYNFNSHRGLLKKPLSDWVPKIEHLAIIPQTGHPKLSIGAVDFPFLRMRNASDPEDTEVGSARCREGNLRFLATIFERFHQLRTFMLVIDGRHPAFGGHAEIVKPTAEFEDYYKEEGRCTALTWTEELLGELRAGQPTLRTCSLQLALLINGQATADLERRWDYYHACCRFYAPDWQGHRPHSEPSD